MLERMNEFLEARLNRYDEHMMTCIESAKDFYPYTASPLPQEPNVKMLDLGCGTGLELGYYFNLNPSAKVTGIDLSARMLDELKRKYPDKEINSIVGSYFDIPLTVEHETNTLLECGFTSIDILSNWGATYTL